MQHEGTDVDVEQVLTGLHGFRVRAAREAEGQLEVEVELVAGEAACPACGVFSASLKQEPTRPQRLGALRALTGSGLEFPRFPGSSDFSGV